MRLIDADSLVKHIRIHCGDCGEAVECIREAPTIVPPPNDPLTLERLREMDGEPVWVQCLRNEDYSGWIIADLCFNGVAAKYFYAYFDYYGEEWLAYRHKPEGG